MESKWYASPHHNGMQAQIKRVCKPKSQWYASPNQNGMQAQIKNGMQAQIKMVCKPKSKMVCKPKSKMVCKPKSKMVCKPKSKWYANPNNNKKRKYKISNLGFEFTTLGVADMLVPALETAWPCGQGGIFC